MGLLFTDFLMLLCITENPITIIKRLLFKKSRLLYLKKKKLADQCKAIWNFQGAYEANCLFNKLPFRTLTVCFVFLSPSLSLSLALVFGREVCVRMIVRDSAGIWQARCLERRPTLWLPFSGPARCEVGKFHWAVHSMAPQSWLQAPANSWRDRAATQVCGKPGQPFRVIVTEQDKPGDHTKKQSVPGSGQGFGGKRTP